MTTLVALSTCDALVMGSDSLGTFVKRVIDPFDLIDYFDDNFELKMGTNGKPLLADFSTIYDQSQPMPYSHMTHVDKLFSLEPLAMGVMFAGEASIGARSIRNLMGEFKQDFIGDNSPQKIIARVGRELLGFLWGFYSKEYPNKNVRPELELMLGGYNPRKYIPGVVRINVHENKMDRVDYEPGAFFGAQAREIQRLAFGTDVENGLRLGDRCDEILKKYHQLLQKDLKKNGIKNIRLKKPRDFGDELDLFKGWKLEGLDTNFSAFSDQNAIECVDFFVNIMIKAQQFSAELPTVGGSVQLAIIKKSGFKWVSRREWHHGDHRVPIKE